MISSSSAFASKINNPPRHFSARLLYQGADIGGELRSLVVHKGSVNAEDGFTVGTVYSSSIEVTMTDLTSDILNKELVLKIGLDLDDNSTEEIEVGHFIPTAGNIKKTAFQTTFTGLGIIGAKFNNELFTVSGTKTLSNIASAISTATGVTVSFSNVSGTSEVITKSLDGLTCYEGLVLLATMVGGYATETNSGEVVITKHDTSVNTVSVGTDRMKALPSFETEDLTMTGVRVVVSEASEDEEGETIEEVSFIQGIPTISIQNTYMTQSIFDNVFKGNVIGYSYRPGTIPLSIGDPRIEPFDNLLVTDYDNQQYTVPCHEVKHSFDGGIFTEIIASTLTNDDDTASSTGPVTQQLEKMNAQLITAQNAIFNRAKITDLEATNAEVMNLSSENADLQHAVIQNATITNLTAINTSLGTALADTLTAEKISAVQAAITNANITNITSDNVYTNLATLDTALANILTANELTAVKAAISQLTVETLAVNNLRAKYADINFANVTVGNITEAWIKNLFIQGGFVSQSGQVFDLVGVRINGDLITANTLKADRLLLQGANGLYYAINVDALGQATASSDPKYQEGIDGKVIVAHSITADEITAQDIRGTGGWINLAEGTFRYFNQNNTSGISWDGTNLTLLVDSINISSAVTVAQDSADDLEKQVNGGYQMYVDLGGNYTTEEKDESGNDNIPLYIQSDGSIGTTVTEEPYLSSGLVNDLEEIRGAISVNPSEPSISLGTEGASLKLTDDRLSFQQSSSNGSELVEVAYISSEEDLGTININNAKINSSLVIGELEFCEVNGGIAVRRAM